MNQKSKIKNNERGYIIITTSIILSLMVIIVAITLGVGNLFTRSDTNDFYNKQTSSAVARSCLNVALLKLATNSNYFGNETVTVSNFQCTLKSITTSGANKVIKAHAAVNGATTNLQLTVVSATLSTVSLEELVHF